MAVSNARPSNSNLVILAGMVLAAVLLSWIAVHWDLDRTIAKAFYTPERGWYLKDRPPWIWLYQYGTIPGLILALSALTIWFVGSIKHGSPRLQRACLIVVLAAVIGPGLIVNATLKSYWGRPRPRHVEMFGGNWQYRHVHQPGTPEKGESFPCGHCSMGFIFCTLFVLRRQYPKTAVAGTAVGIVLGTLLGIARVVQGAHFPTDVLWSFTLVVGVALLLNTFIPADGSSGLAVFHRRKGDKAAWLRIGVIVAAIAMTTAFLMHRPFFEDHRINLELSPSVRRIALNVNVPVEKMHVRFTDNRMPVIEVEAKGFSWPGVSYRLKSDIEQTASGLVQARLTVLKKGYFAELTHEVALTLPKALENTVEVKLIDTADATGRVPGKQVHDE